MYKLGIDLGGTNIKMVILNENNEVWNSFMTPTPKMGGRLIEDHMVAGVRNMLEEKGISVSDVENAGIAVPGVVKAPKGPVLLAPNVGWSNHDPISYMEEKLGIDFTIGNDADCMALGESKLGAGKKFESFVMLTLGTGVGGAIVNRGEIFTGFMSYGGELGHIPLVHGGIHCNCGQDGCLEQYASATALKRMAREISGHDYDPRDLFRDLRAGDETAEKIVDIYVVYLAEGITGFINVVRPHGIILGGGIAQSGEILYKKINEKLSTMAYCSDLIPIPPVVPAALGMYAGAQGAAFL